MSAQNEAFEKANPHKLISVTSDQVEVLNELRKYDIQKKINTFHCAWWTRDPRLVLAFCVV